jgi:hypothetical protein
MPAHQQQQQMQQPSATNQQQNSSTITIGPSMLNTSSSTVLANYYLPSPSSGVPSDQANFSSSTSINEPELKKVKLTHEFNQPEDSIRSSSKMALSSSTDNPEMNNNLYLVHKKLEERIGGILCCTVCLDLPQTAIYQVK